MRAIGKDAEQAELLDRSGVGRRLVSEQSILLALLILTSCPGSLALVINSIEPYRLQPFLSRSDPRAGP